AEILAFAERIDATVITTFKGKGIVPDDHPLGCGVLGRSGIPVASLTMLRADCLLVLGASFSNHTSIATWVPTIQVDLDRMILGKFHPVEVPSARQRRGDMGQGGQASVDGVHTTIQNVLLGHADRRRASAGCDVD